MNKGMSSTRQFCSSLVVWFCLSAVAQAGDWPTYRHDYSRSGQTDEQLAAEKLLQYWVVRSPQAPQPAWPGPAKWDAYAGIRGLSAMRNYDAVFHMVIAGDSLYYGSSADDALHCIATTDGTERWSFRTDAPLRVAPSVADGRVFFGSDDGHAYSVDAASGQQIWKSESPVQEKWILNNGRMISRWPCRTGVVVDERTAWFGLSFLPWRESYLCAVDAETGKAEGTGRYVRKLADQTLEGGLLLGKERLVALRGRVPPFVFDRQNGHELGSFKAGGGGSFATLTKEGGLLHGPGNKTGWTTLSRLATRERVSTLEGKTAVVITDDREVLLDANAVSAVDLTTKQVLWTVPWHSPEELIVAGQHVFVGGDGEIEAIRLQDGRRVWRAEVEGRAHGLAVADGALFASTDEGAIYCYRPTNDSNPLSTEKTTVRPSDVAPPRGSKISSQVRTPGRVGHWLFHSGMGDRARRRGASSPERHVADLAGSLGGLIQGDVLLREVGGVEALEFDGEKTSVLIERDLNRAQLPSDAISVEAWVRIAQPTTRGGIIGAIQDNSDELGGWLLDYSESRFRFAVAGQQGPGDLTYLASTTEIEAERWYHVAGTYDGTTQRIYVDGNLENRSTTQKGPINYPAEAFYEIGACHDADEYLRMTGMLHEVSVYDSSLTPQEVASVTASKRALFPVPIQLEIGPYSQFISNDRAVVRWQTAKASATLLDFEGPAGSRRIVDEVPKTDHRVLLSDLPRDRLAKYVIRTRADGKEVTSPEFELDTSFNYMKTAKVGSAPFAPDPSDQRVDAFANQVLSQTKLDRGICLILGIRTGRLAWELIRQSGLRVICVDTDETRVAAARKALSAGGVYGTRIAVHHVESFARLPFVGRFANLILSERFLLEGKLVFEGAEMYRVLRPSGGIALLSGPSQGPNKLSKQSLKQWLDSAALEYRLDDDEFSYTAKVTRGPLEGAGEWSHLYGRADNSAYGGEDLAGARTKGELEVQWIGRPGPRAQPDRNGRKPSPLSVNGRLFVQGLHRLIGIDAFNGSILWSLEIPSLERFNMPRDCGNWCADSERVFVAIADKCWQIDAQSGVVEKTHSVIGGNTSEWKYDWSYVARVGEVLLGSAIKKGTAFTNFWGSADAGWYDARSGSVTFKACSENLFAIDAITGNPSWTYSQGVIINSTITATQNRVYFVECRHPAVKASNSRRVGMEELWQQQYLVALDVETGETVWEKPIDTQDGHVVYSMACGGERLIVVASTNKHYEVSAFAASDGNPLWQQRFGWLGGKGDHGKAMSRPAIVGDSVYVRPKVLELSTGRIREIEMPGGGCGTYAATTHAIFFRSGNVTAWNSETGSQTSWNRLRPGCWLSTIPAGGMLLSPEAGGGCSCGNWMETSLGFMPVR